MITLAPAPARMTAIPAPIPLAAPAIAIVKAPAPAPAIGQHGVAITTAMYARLFRNAEVATMFDRTAKDSGEQPRRLAAAILISAEAQAYEDAVAA